MPEDNRYITVTEFEKKNSFIYKDVKRDMDTTNKRIDKYSEKTETLVETINEIKISQAKMLAYQEADAKSSTRIIELLTENIKSNKKEIIQNRKRTEKNKSRITYFAGGVTALAFIFTYLWNSLTGK